MTQKPSVWLEFSPLAQATGSINLGQGFPDWAPPEFIQEAAAEAVRGNGFSSYARSPGHLPLVRAIASQYGKTLSMDISAEKQVLVTVGASEALYLALSTFVSRGDEVIVIEPAFDLYFGCLDWIGATVRSVPLVSDGEGSPSSSGEFQIDWQQLKTSLSPKTKAILI
ncbi:MAG: aminotransferase class I/II-fold pyridoxal phosphate-dependent enzyme, partial [Gammaproteobacteria bacterium]|nr:aminotransferase class I/II-fold pyridoxal phosphate-dependent enzyme [Gammaproteobacteria bacterium]